MSSNIPVRRTTRTTKVTKDNENANAKKPTRIMTRAKTQASAAAGTAGASEGSRLASTTASSRAKAVDAGQGLEKTATKRKREILGEVTERNGKAKAAGTGKGKEKVEGVKSKAPTKTARAPLREVGGTATTTTQRPVRSSRLAGERQALKPLREDADGDEIMDDKPQQSSLATRAAVFKLAHQEQAQHSTRAQSSSGDEVEREPVFKKRLTEVKVELQTVVEVEQKYIAVVDDCQEDEERIATELADVNEDDEDSGLWDDLDAEDAEDPLMVAEYIQEIMVYMKELEVRTAPMANYMDFHSELDWDKRSIVLEWILQIHSRYQFLPESFFLCVNIMDRFLSLRPLVSLRKLQLVGVACFCVAVKFEEGISPSTQELRQLMGDAFTTEEICKAERYVLKTINFDLSYPGPMSWLRRGSKADDLEPGARTIGKYLLELACFVPSLVAIPTSLVAASSLWLARLFLGREEWTHNLVHYTSYKEREIIPIGEVLLNYILDPAQIETLYKKYASKRYMKCSVYVRKWALERFPSGSEIDLHKALPTIKSEILEARLAKIAEEERFSSED